MSDLNTAVTAAFEQINKEHIPTALQAVEQQAIADYRSQGWPTQKLEYWKYTRLNPLVQKPFQVPQSVSGFTFNPPATDRLSAAVQEFDRIVLVNGLFMEELSVFDKNVFEVLLLAEAAVRYPEQVEKYLNQSRKYITDGLQALNTAFVQNGLFVRVKKNAVATKPLFINHITDGRSGNVFVQPRILVLAEENTQAQLGEVYFHLGAEESFTNEVIEIAAHENAHVEYYKIQQLPATAHHVGTTHIQQVGKCYTHCVTITLSGGTLRNNLNMVFDKAHNEGHMYGLYLVDGTTHIDNQTVVDNAQPGCFSNELYKGVIDGKATAVFNGRIYVRKDAQQTNAYQSNRNILIGANASVNAKPQLEIFADDVKCSHGCTVGRLDETALFYMRTRGIGEEMARALLLQAFAADIVEQVNIPVLKQALQEMIAERLHTELI
ncbi:MAG: Fe-S cluster assembly protein SufD [Dinghuibacter sp.]|nr:Fe-S cluster assembly protein SufD [Dinghuibacter sp.]